MSERHRHWPQPIPTRYDGYHFRSKNEARWAAFYNHLGIPYRYEVDRYQVNGATYLIDFEFQEQEEKGITECLVEIKPKEPTAEECAKAEWLAQTRGIPVYIFFGDQRCPSERNGAQGILYGVRNAWLSYEGQRLPQALPISHEIRVALLRLSDLGFQFQFTYQHSLPSAFHLGPGDQRSHLSSSQDLLERIHHLHEMETDLVETAHEAVNQFLLQQPSCERRGKVEWYNYLSCCELDASSLCTDKRGRCILDQCQDSRRLRRLLSERHHEEKPCLLTLEFDESRSPEPHYWAQCTDCKALGIFPGSFKHDLFCSLYCQYTEYHMLEGMAYATEEAYQMANHQLVDVEAKMLHEAYMAAREEPFRKKTR